MKNLLLTLILCITMAGCRVKPVNVSEFDIVKTEGFIAFLISAELASGVNPQPDSPKNECTCNGTKVIKQADGHVTECPCGKDCKCKKNEAKKPARRVLLFTDPKNCSPCRKFEKNERPKLESNNWTFGKEDTNLIQIVDLQDKESVDLLNKYKVNAGIPTLVLLQDEKEVGRNVGFMTANEFTDWFYDK